VTPQETAHLRMLRFIEDNPEMSQRELARRLGVSVGKTHYLLKALLEKGLVKMDDFRRHGNKLAYAYLLTPSGIATKLSLTKSFLRHKEAEYQSLRGEIDQLREELDATVQGDAS
jgi:EPS-associated MarR family transcriptional regulator